MNQKFIRPYGGQTYTVAEGAELLAELDARTASSQNGYNSIDELATQLKDVIQGLELKRIKIEGENFTYIPIKGSDGLQFSQGDLALDGWITQTKYAKILSYKGAGDPELFASWNEVETIGE